MPIDHDSGWVEPDIVINGRALTFAECMSVRVAVSSFRISLSDPVFRAGVGEPLAGNYDHHLAHVEQTMLQGLKGGARRQMGESTDARTAGAGPGDALADEDRAALQAIVREDDDRARLRLVHAYWRDFERSERTPRTIAYLHLGLLGGMCDRLLDQRERLAATVSWGDTREKAE